MARTNTRNSSIEAAAENPAARPRSAARRMPPMLVLAFGLSFILHAVLLSVTFVMPSPPAVKERDRGLEVVLVNARHARAPEKAEALAQANLDGGGTTDESVRAKSPLPPQETRREGDALVQAKKRAPQPEPPTKDAVLTKPKAETKVAKAPPPKIEEQPVERPPLRSGLDLLDSAAAVARLEAQIDRQLEEYAKRPRKKFIGSKTREYRFAQYVEDWRQKIERVGTLNYPDSARGRLYGSLLLSVVIRADGSVERIQIQRSSGEKVLDEAAVRIVELAAPFAAFPPDIRSDTDILEITRTWTFTNQDRLKAH